ncbi:MAG: SurA N-terminal domain-containing protein [Acidobacteria bacterium]|nr:SurA N-terminal domain-containing protein [Acidobacteriota bacterium]
MRKANFTIWGAALLAFALLMMGGCSGSGGGSNSSQPNANEAAATVNGKVIKMEEVERALKQQAQGQEGKLSPLELAAARLQILEQLIQNEVMYQKAEKAGTVPTDDEVTAEYNKTRTQSNMSQEQWDKLMKDSGQTEASARESIKKSLAIKKLIDSVTGKVEPPKDSEVEAFFNSNKDAFVKKKGVKLAAIVIDPANNGEGDTTVDEQSAVLAGNDIIKQLNAGADFTQLAREKSEDQSRFQGGDLGYISEEDMKQSFPEQVVASLMNPQTRIGQIVPARIQGKFYILKLQERSDRDEVPTLESPGVRESATNQLINSRKQLLAASFQAIAMNEAKIVNNLAQKVVDNPNDLSGARPASSETPAANTNANTAANAPANSNANTKPANAPAKPETKPAANTAKSNTK